MGTGGDWVLVLAGGEGRRLEAETIRRFGFRRPKQFCDFGAGESLLASTLSMAAELVDQRRVVLSTIRRHRSEVVATVGSFPDVVVVEQPQPRGTLPGILLPMRDILLSDADAVVTVLPSDHHWKDVMELRTALARESANVRRQPGQIALFGVEPENDCRGLGLFVPASSAPDGSIERFCEKPDADEIPALRRAGALVNTFVMVGHVSTFVHQMAKASTSWWRGLSRGPLDPRLDEDAYATLDPADFSKDVIETRLGAFRGVQLGPVGWSDLGEPGRLERVWPNTA